MTLFSRNRHKIPDTDIEIRSIEDCSRRLDASRWIVGFIGAVAAVTNIRYNLVSSGTAAVTHASVGVSLGYASAMVHANARYRFESINTRRPRLWTEEDIPGPILSAIGINVATVGLVGALSPTSAIDSWAGLALGAIGGAGALAADLRTTETTSRLADMAVERLVEANTSPITTSS